MRSFRLLLVFALALLMAPALRAQQFVQKQAAPPKTEKIAAVVNGESIPESEITSAVQRQLHGRTIAPEQAKQLRQMVLQMIIDGRLLDQYLADKKIQVDPKAVDAVIDQYKKQIAGSGMPFEDVLKRQGLSEQALRARVAKQLAFQNFAESSLTDKALQDYFNAHKEDLNGTEVRASHILVKVPKNASESERQAALTKIKSIRQEIAKGLDFAEAAKKYSDCPSKAEGGDLNFFPRRNAMVEPFAAAAFSMPKGQMSQPVQTDFGWHLIKVTDRKQGDKGFNEVRDDIKEILAGELYERTVAQQRKVAKIEIRD